MKIVALLLTTCALMAQVKHEDIVRSPNEIGRAHV